MVKNVFITLLPVSVSFPANHLPKFEMQIVQAAPVGFISWQLAAVVLIGGHRNRSNEVQRLMASNNLRYKECVRQILQGNGFTSEIQSLQNGKRYSLQFLRCIFWFSPCSRGNRQYRILFRNLILKKKVFRYCSRKKVNKFKKYIFLKCKTDLILSSRSLFIIEHLRHLIRHILVICCLYK